MEKQSFFANVPDWLKIATLALFLIWICSVTQALKDRDKAYVIEVHVVDDSKNAAILK